MKRKLSRFYSFFGVWNKLAIKNFYKRLEIIGNEADIAEDVPVIFCPNHQNAFIDALNVVGAMKKNRQPTFMTRSDIFGTIFDPILNKFKMLPIYRQRDKVNVVEKNEEIFRICVDRLSRGEPIIIFPEGSHNKEYKVRPLKKGFARIAFQAEMENQYSLDVKVVPVGLNYDNHRKFKSDLLVIFGETIHVSDFYEMYSESPNKALMEIRNVLNERLERCVLHISQSEYYRMINQLRIMLRPEMLKHIQLSGKSLFEEFQADKASIALIEAQIESDTDDLEKLKKNVQDYSAGIKKLKLREHVLADSPFSLAKLLASIPLFLLFFPLFLYGLINNYIPYKIADEITLRYFKDDHFHSSIRMGAGMFLFPIYYLILFGIAWAITNSWWMSLLYLVSLPLSGNFAVLFSEKVKKWYARFRFSRLKMKGNQHLEQLLEWRKEIFQTVIPWLQNARQTTH